MDETQLKELFPNSYGVKANDFLFDEDQEIKFKQYEVLQFEK